MEAWTKIGDPPSVGRKNVLFSNTLTLPQNLIGYHRFMIGKPADSTPNKSVFKNGRFQNAGMSGPWTVRVPKVGHECYNLREMGVLVRV